MTSERNTNVEWHYDAGHEWLRVPLVHLLDRPQLHASISAYSYRDGIFAYLEGDCDAARYVDAMGITLEGCREVNDGDWSRIRKLARFEAPHGWRTADGH